MRACTTLLGFLASVAHENAVRQRVAADARRDRALSRLGYRVLRLDAALVMARLPEAVARVRDALRE
jgi:very-short-patch-repair endonuclease